MFVLRPILLGNQNSLGYDIMNEELDEVDFLYANEN